MDQLKAAFQGFPHPRSFLEFAANEARRLDSTTLLLFAGFVTVILAVFASQLLVIWQFVWNCFLQPLGKQTDQAGRLNRFYSGQAEIYDKTRSKLLRGRGTMLKLSAAHLREQRRKDPSKRLVWLDIGGGTGWNVEEMNKHFPIAEFDAVYVLDLCAPLLEVSRKRFAALGMKNVQCLLQDATTFVLPEWESGEVARELDFVTMSYSLSMMPNFYALLDRVDHFLCPTGLLSVCDFYVSAREKTSLSEIIGDVASRHCSWLTRMFWLHWFEFDHVDLHPSRRQYLEHLFGTIKSFNGRNRFILPWLIQIPYYVNIATSRRTDTSSANQAYEVDAGNTISASASPLLTPMRSNLDPLPDLSLGLAALSQGLSSGGRSRRNSAAHSDTHRLEIAPELPLSAFHYGSRQFRVPYLDLPVHKEFRTWIYGFTWEDPAVDMQYLNLTKDDSVLCITSAGDNALHYAIAAQVKRIHAVDMNPAQGHLLELKLAAIASLPYEDFWKMFGDGVHPDFRNLLDSKISPFLTSHAYQFWRANDKAFSSSFYLRGYSGWALRLAKIALWIGGLEEETHNFCHAPTLEKQKEIWDTKFRPVILSRWIVKVFLSNPAFLWNALGVPNSQAEMFLNETTTENFAIDTLDPVAYNTHIASGAYHYQVCLEQKYTKESCPLYLTKDGFEMLKANDGQVMNAFRLHTESIINVMKQLGKDTLTVAVLMDLQDWFPNSILPKKEQSTSKVCELTSTIRTLHNSLKPNGRVFWRSSAINPWYAELYRREGFEVKRLQERVIGDKTPIDRVNMYASFWQATKL